MRFAYPPYSIRPLNRVEALGASLPGGERGCCEHGAQAAVGFFDQCCPVALFDDAACVEDDEVIGVAAGFPTTVNPILQYGAVPVFVAVDPETYNIDDLQYFLL